MKINIPVRMRNWAFWVGLGATLLAAMDISPEMFTDWSILGQAVVDLINNPYRLGCVVFAIMGVFVDPTTAGIGDSARALTYKKPNKE